MFTYIYIYYKWWIIQLFCSIFLWFIPLHPRSKTENGNGLPGGVSELARGRPLGKTFFTWRCIGDFLGGCWYHQLLKLITGTLW